MKNNIVVVFSSHLSEEENNKFISHIKETIGVQHKTICYPNFGQFGLPQIYNDALKTHAEKDCVFVFCHNDMVYKTKNWGKVLLNQFNHTDYAIIGLAGTTFLPASGMWWEDRSKMYGIVEHTNGMSTWVSEYSPQFNGVKPVIIIDGLFMGVDPDQIVKNFNENYGLFHFYDLPFCVDNYLKDVNIGVTASIRVLHKSMGQTNPDWDRNRIKFASEYNLPIRHVSEGRLKVLLCCQFFKNYTGSEMSNYELSKELVKQGCDVTIISQVVGEPLHKKALANGVRVCSYINLPNYVLDQDGKFHFIKNEQEFDIIHINHKPIGELMLGLYPNTPAVMHVRSEVIPTFEEPIINPRIARYISIRDSITDYIRSYGIEADKIVTIDNPFDTKRFNTNYTPVKNPKEIVLFIGTLDHLRKNILLDLVEMTRTNGQLLQIIGADNGGYANILVGDHVKYLGVKQNVEEYIKKCDYTAGIFKGRTTIEGFLCGKPGWIYVVDDQGNIQNKELQEVPQDLEKYHSDFSANKVFTLYEEVIAESW
jgi:glycosyltransferase involved in cell wall biosynthesis